MLQFANFIIQLVAVIDSSSSDGDDWPKGVNGQKYYQTLPIISIIIPNPITSGMTAFTDCNEFNNCGESYRDLYTAAFWLNMVMFGPLIILLCMCCGVGACGMGALGLGVCCDS